MLAFAKEVDFQYGKLYPTKKDKDKIEKLFRQIRYDRLK